MPVHDFSYESRMEERRARLDSNKDDGDHSPDAALMAQIC